MNWIQILGYTASIVILIGMTMNSIRLLRWINLFGATMFATYGYTIGAYPVGLLNSFIAMIDVYYLFKMYNQKEFFKTIAVKGNNLYLIEFLKFYKDEIKKFFPSFSYDPTLNKYSFFILRNMNVAGIVLAREFDKQTLKISLDFTVPQYRDFKVGKYIYKEYAKKFFDDGYEKLIVFPENKSFEKYLKKMGFVKFDFNGKKSYILELKKSLNKI